MRASTLSLPLALAALAIGAGGCGDDDDSNGGGGGGDGSAQSQTSTEGGAASSGGGASTQLRLSAPASGALAFDKKSLQAKAGKVTIAFDNPSSIPHAVEVEGNGVEEETRTFTNGKADLTVNLKPGTYEFYCPVDGHEDAGMKGTLTVR
jgi:plastocyanin